MSFIFQIELKDINETLIDEYCCFNFFLQFALVCRRLRIILFIHVFNEINSYVSRIIINNIKLFKLFFIDCALV